MKAIYLTSAFAILAVAAPATAQAQLLGGSGGIGGAIGGTLGGGGAISGPLGRPTETLRSATRNEANASAGAQGNRSVDTKSGAVASNGSVDTAASASAAQKLDTPLAGLTGGAAAGRTLRPMAA